MASSLLEGVGGLGLFLLGMFVMTDGLKGLAGRSLRRALRRYTRGPVSGAVTGMVATAVIQSSSATTITAVGLVGAGLLTFGQALGIILGANIGTTMTGWLVALFGFQVPLGTLAYPIVFVGAVMRLLGRGRLAALGQALAGFAAIFIGIGLMQTGLSSLADAVTPASFPGNTIGGRFQLVLIGVAITLVTQSSSAGIAMALAAVHTGSISFPQAAAVVIGMNIGTTVTAAFATIGGSTQVRRTGFAHVTYNLLIGIGAFLLLVPYVTAVEALPGSVLSTQPELCLVGFHTLFNTLGVIAVLPFANRFARLIEVLIPVPDDDPSHRLDKTLLDDADAALDAVESTLSEVLSSSLAILERSWTQLDPEDTSGELEPLRASVAEATDYTTRIRNISDSVATRSRHSAALHAADHLDRLISRIARPEHVETLRANGELTRLAQPLQNLVSDALTSQGGDRFEPRAQAVSESLSAELRPHRKRVITSEADVATGAGWVDARLDVMRWLVRMAGHLWRIVHYLERMSERTPERPQLPASDEHDSGD